MSNFQRIHRQLATNNHRRPANLNPAFVERGFVNQGVRIILCFLVVSSVEELDDLTVFENRVRNPDLMTEALGNSLRDGRFSIAWLAVQEQACARVDRWSEAFKQ